MILGREGCADVGEVTLLLPLLLSLVEEKGFLLPGVDRYVDETGMVALRLALLGTESGCEGCRLEEDVLEDGVLVDGITSSGMVGIG